jgi:small multidrug resistance pump
MSSVVPSLVWGSIAYTIFGVAMVLMKLGEPFLAAPRQVFKDPALTKSLLFWLGGIAGNFAFATTLAIALGNGHASVVSALNGVGLIVIAVLSWVFLKERLSKAGLAGMALVVVGVALIGLFSLPPGPAPALDDGTMVMFFGVVLFTCVGAGGVSLARPALGGPFLGAAAGALGGAAILFQKIFVGPLMQEPLGPWALTVALATSFFFWCWSAAASSSFVVLQVAFRLGDATKVSPAMVSAMILVPQAGGVALFAEELALGQLLGTALVLVGVVLLTATPSAAPDATSSATAPDAT